jgi:hypothetical protein
VSVRRRWAVVAMVLALVALAALFAAPFTVVADVVGPF